MGSDNSRGARNEEDWKFRNVKWGLVFSRQDYANILASLMMIAALIATNYATTPRHPAFFIYDATISYPHIGAPTIPSWVPVLIPFIMLIGTVVIGEYVYSHREHRSLTDCLATMIYFVFDGVQAFVFTITITVITKVVCGRLRPDFLARCQPQNAYIATNSNGVFIVPYGQNVAGQYPCTSTNDAELEDGYKSFPSGHSSTGFCLTVYASAYLIWCFHMRKDSSPAIRNWSFKRKFMSDLGNICAKYWMLAMLMFSWGVALSRAIDYQHNYSDIVGGAFLGTIIAIVYALRAIPRYKRVLSPLPAEMAGSPAKEAVAAENFIPEEPARKDGPAISPSRFNSLPHTPSSARARDGANEAGALVGENNV